VLQCFAGAKFFVRIDEKRVPQVGNAVGGRLLAQLDHERLKSPQSSGKGVHGLCKRPRQGCCVGDCVEHGVFLREDNLSLVPEMPKERGASHGAVHGVVYDDTVALHEGHWLIASRVILPIRTAAADDR
jgi:hypothetical protein